VLAFLTFLNARAEEVYTLLFPRRRNAPPGGGGCEASPDALGLATPSSLLRATRRTNDAKVSGGTTGALRSRLLCVLQSAVFPSTFSSAYDGQIPVSVVEPRQGSTRVGSRTTDAYVKRRSRYTHKLAVCIPPCGIGGTAKERRPASVTQCTDTSNDPTPHGFAVARSVGSSTPAGLRRLASRRWGGSGRVCEGKPPPATHCFRYSSSPVSLASWVVHMPPSQAVHYVPLRTTTADLLLRVARSRRVVLSEFMLCEQRRRLAPAMCDGRPLPGRCAMPFLVVRSRDCGIARRYLDIVSCSRVILPGTKVPRDTG